MTNGKFLLTAAAVVALVLPAMPADADNNRRDRPVKVDLLATGLAGSIGGTVGPDGALYVPEFALGQITRIDPETGARSTFASGFPLPAFLPVGGAFDVAFHGGEAYVLVTLVDAPQFLNDLGVPDTGQSGLYRVTGPSSWEVVADLGEFSRANPPTGFEYVAPEGVQFALEVVDDGFLVTDGHLNRVLFVTPSGDVNILKQYGNSVPAGLDLHRGEVHLAETGAVAGTPGSYQEIGLVSAFEASDPSSERTVAGGISMAVDVQSGPGRSLYALSQGIWDPNLGPDAAGAPALPFTGQLLRINDDGSSTVIVSSLLLPTSLHFIGGTAYVVTLAGDVWKVRGISGAARK